MLRIVVTILTLIVCRVSTELLISEQQFFADIISSSSEWSKLDWQSNSTAQACDWSGVVCDLQGARVTSIVLNGTNIPSIIPDSICNLGSLNTLFMTHMGLIGSIPNSIGCLSNLTSLNLSNNKLSGTIPDSVGNLSKLESLVLIFNNLTGEIPVNLAVLSEMKNINLAFNRLQGCFNEQLSSSVVYCGLNDNELCCNEQPTNNCFLGSQNCNSESPNSLPPRVNVPRDKSNASVVYPTLILFQMILAIF